MITDTERVLALTEPVASVADYRAMGGGQGLAIARKRAPEWVIGVVRAAGLRGRGGAGFPTATKWATVRAARGPTSSVICNAAEGEPGTFKDRHIIRRNPYQVLEGMAIAGHAVGAGRAFLVIKRRFEREIAILAHALLDMRRAELLGDFVIQLVLGPDEYLLGEENAAIEVIEGAAPLPTISPPYQVGPFARRGSRSPTVMNNVETLAHVPEIVRRGADAFRENGTDTSPGTSVFTVSGDVQLPGVHELPLGLPLRLLVDLVAGGVGAGHRVKAVVPGASGGLLTEEALDTPLDFESMLAAGSSLGSGGFVVYDDTACIVAITLAFARFLSSGPVTDALDRIERGEGSVRDLDTILSSCDQRCGLPTGAATLMRSAMAAFAEEFEAHLGRPCPTPRDLPVPKIVDYDEETGEFRYDERYRHAAC
jgi:NADH-quinone oxidoreductase subunit F